MNQLWALLQDAVVLEITDIDPVGRFHPDFEWVHANTDVLPGDIYNDGEFSRPAPTSPPPKTVYTVREFMRRFTVDEQLSIRQSQFTDMEVGLAYDRFNRGEFIDVDDPDVAAGIDLYISKGLLDEGRKEALLSPVSASPG